MIWRLINWRYLGITAGMAMRSCIGDYIRVEFGRVRPVHNGLPGDDWDGLLLVILVQATRRWFDLRVGPLPLPLSPSPIIWKVPR